MSTSSEDKISLLILHFHIKYYFKSAVVIIVGLHYQTRNTELIYDNE